MNYFHLFLLMKLNIISSISYRLYSQGEKLQRVVLLKNCPTGSQKFLCCFVCMKPWLWLPVISMILIDTHICTYKYNQLIESECLGNYTYLHWLFMFDLVSNNDFFYKVNQDSLLYCFYRSMFILHLLCYKQAA